ncbi:MAG: ABC-2 transporter permease [Epulopiscium sp.]|nr:ABC-2 transporter permease [Candidatus Epulonipiscium sp.]
MINLLIKDLNLLFKTSKLNLLVILFPIALSLAAFGGGLPFIPNIIVYTFSIFMAIYFSITISTSHEEKNKGETLLNSMPISREDIVKGKYILPLVYLLIYFIIIYILTNFLSLMGIGKNAGVVSTGELIASMNLIFLFYSIYLPAYFKSENGMAGFNQFFYMVIIILPSISSRFSKYLSENKFIGRLSKLASVGNNLILLIIIVTIYIISLQISKQIYINKEI